MKVNTSLNTDLKMSFCSWSCLSQNLLECFFSFWVFSIQRFVLIASVQVEPVIIAGCIYSGFTFSQYDLPFPTSYCIAYVRSGLYQLVIRVKGIRVGARLRSHSHLVFAFYSKFGLAAWRLHFLWASCRSCFACGTRWLFLLSCHSQSMFCCFCC